LRRKDNAEIDAEEEKEEKEKRRNRWKAASGRYYASHPEIKEKKRKRMAKIRCVCFSS
jgi:hypothetical protein